VASSGVGSDAEELIRMVVPHAEPGATADLGPPGAGSTRKLTLDEMAAERERAPLPPAPVLTLQPVPVDAAPIGAGRRGAMKRLAEVEALARNNLRAAEEARRVVEAERALLEEEANARTQAERTAAALRREIERLRSTEEQRAAQARVAATRQARTELESEMERVHDEHARVVDELDRMRGTLFDHDTLLDEYSQRLHDEQEAQAKARADLVRAEEAQRAAERNLEIALETARRRAEDDHARLVRVEEQLRDTTVERDRVAAELRAITEGDGELVRLRAEAKAAHEDMTRLLADLDVQAARADKAESDLATALETTVRAEKLAAEATEARDLAGIDLETTRRELAERNQLLDSERSESQARVADLSAQLTTITRSAESSAKRVTELEAELAAALSARDDASAHAAAFEEQLEHSGADVEELRKHAVTIGDELASTHAALELSQVDLTDTRRQLDDTRSRLDEARRDLERARRDLADAPLAAAVDEIVTVAPSLDEVAPIDAKPVDAAPAVPESGVSAFDAAIASAFGTTTEPEVEVEVEQKVAPKVAPKRRSAPVTTFRTVDSGIEHKRSGGPEVEREAALVRGAGPAAPVPVDAEAAGAVLEGEEAVEGETPETEPAPVPAWRRTAMAELTALAADSDDLTPRRRR
jgi:chromosome segregation ATPase